jgi:Zn-dependent M28 family amino/carboxypeptidase
VPAAAVNETPPTDEPLLEQRLSSHVVELAGAIGERNVWRPDALRAAARYIRGAFESAGCDVRPQWYVAQGMRCENLEVTLPGTEGGDEIIVVGAHYDTVPGSPGADDNASGVAGVIEIARALRPASLRRTVKLAAFVNEEAPFFYSNEMGSWVYAQAARRRGDDIRLMVSLEMLGCYSDAPGSQAYPPLLRWLYPDRGNFIAFVSDLQSRHALDEMVRAFRSSSDFPVEHLASPAAVPGVALSDHLSFWRAGYPALMVTDTAFYRYTHYHSASDTPDRIDYRRMARVVDGLAKAIALLGDANTIPRRNAAIPRRWWS